MTVNLDADIAALHRGNVPVRAALYLRVSTGGQTTANQRMQLERTCQMRGWTVVAVFEDAGISGSKGRSERPGLDKALNAGKRGDYDILAAWALDRLGRSTIDLQETLVAVRANKTALFLQESQIDTTTAVGQMFYTIMSATAQFERDMIRSRVKAGMERARAQGVRLGRPRTVDEDRIRAYLKAGRGVQWIRRELSCGASAVQRVEEEMYA